ncbi:hypothetical protein M413DRAFT_445880 [Hebeloma cylindrosporum]|uniref:SH3 domain-containing protein n=1 Tax=Hebeloma cylindrosporum TaxID=76867 RepID=A0A0C3CAE5_HEBCY|nr:hypothetical protein M413DRAFT_445880 [Hebeloma cylindrosporum h7]
MRVVRRTVSGRSIVDNAIHAREPQLLKLPLPVPSIPILAPLVSPIVGGNNQNTQPTTTPANTPPPAQPTSPVTPPPSNGGGAVPPTDSTPSPGGDGSSPVPPVVVPDPGTGSGDNPPPGSPGSSPTTGDGTDPSGVAGGPIPTSGPVSEGAGGTIPTTGSDNFVPSDPSASVGSGVANAGGAPQGSLSKISGGTYTYGAGDPTSTTSGKDSNGTAAASAAAKGGISPGAVAAIVVVFITLFFLLIILFLRRRSKARRDERAVTWWFSRKRTSQTYGDRNSAEIFASGSRSARSSFATTVDHSFTAFPTDAPTIPPLPPMAEVGRANTTSLQLAINPSPHNNEVPDKRFSIGSNHSENSQYLFVNIRNSLQLTPLTGQAFSPSEAFAFPKPPSPAGDRASAYSRPSSHQGTAVSMKRPDSDDSFFPSLPAIPPTPSAVPLIPSDPFASDPFGDNNPFEDPQRVVAPVLPPTAFAEKESIRRPFERTRSDELTVINGEYVRILTTFDDGWAYVVKVPASGSDGEDASADSKGLIPIDCLREPGQDLPTFIAAKRVSSYGHGGAVTAM